MYPIITQSISTVRNIKLIDIEYNLPIDLYIAMVIAVRIKRGNADIIMVIILNIKIPESDRDLSVKSLAKMFILLHLLVQKICPEKD